MNFCFLLLFLVAAIFPFKCHACSQLLTTPNGTFSSPNYPSSYPSNSECDYKILVPRGKRILLRIVKLDIENSAGCVYDSLSVHDGSSVSDSNLATLCGNGANGKEYKSSGYIMFVKFKSDSSYNKAGFLATYSIVGADCNMELNGTSGFFSSPDYPNNYRNNADCTYTITVPRGLGISFDFQQFDLEGGSNCEFDKLEIFLEDGIISRPRSPKRRFCGSGPQTFSASTNKVVMRFVSDASTSKSGFTAKFKAFEKVKVNSPECGQRKLAQSRVIGGKNATKGAWPWQIGMYKHKRFRCGGTLITPEWILTAAHCVTYDSGRVQYAGNFKIVLGDLHRELSETTEQSYDVDKIISHPYYDKYLNNNDIALMKLSHPAILNDHVNTACLPDQDHMLSPGTPCFITGWGKIKHPGTTHVMLQQALLPVLDIPTCMAKLMNAGWGLIITDAMVCGGVPGSVKSGCHGDSGGPFVCPNTKGRFVLQGSVSWGSPKCDTAEAYSVFARVAKFRNWVDAVIKNH